MLVLASKSAAQSSSICHDLPPLIVLCAELHICRDYSHLNCDDDSQGTNHKAEAKDVVKVALQSNPKKSKSSLVSSFDYRESSNACRSTAHCSGRTVLADLPNGCHGKVEFDKDGSEWEETSCGE